MRPNSRCTECGQPFFKVEHHTTHPACRVADCERPIRTRKNCLCNAHNLRLLRTGSVGSRRIGDRSRPKADPVERFWSKVDRSGQCWLWTASASSTGYGSFRLDKRTYNAHRFAYELVRGPVPEGLVLDHLCRVRRCVNPDHLEAVPERVNVLDRSMSPTAILVRTNRCKRGHEFTPENTQWQNRTRTKKTCRTCANDRQRRAARARRVA